MAVVKNTYETIFLVNPTVGEEKANEIAEKFTSLISANAEDVSIDNWGKRRLAYPIDKCTDAYYTLVTFKSVPNFPLELERIYGISDGIIRFITVKKQTKS